MGTYRYEAKKLVRSRICVILFALLTVLNLVSGLTAQKAAKDGDYSTRYAAELDSIIYNAKMNYIGIEDKESENAVYQLEVIKHYSRLSAQQVDREVSGFDTLLSSTMPYASALLLGMLVAVMLVYREHSSPLILSSFKHGRVKICLSKLVLLFVTLFAGLSVFLVSQGFGVALGSGFSGFSAPIQSIPSYIHCPYLLTVGEAVLLRALFALITAFAVSLAVFLLGTVSGRPYGSCCSAFCSWAATGCWHMCIPRKYFRSFISWAFKILSRISGWYATAAKRSSFFALSSKFSAYFHCLRCVC